MENLSLTLASLAAFIKTFEGMIHSNLSMDDCIRMGVTTPDQLIKHDELSYFYFDGYKAAYGRKARHVNFQRLTLAELELKIEILQVAIEGQEAQEAAQEKADLSAFEASVQTCIEHGAGDRKTALRWLLEAASDIDTQFGLNDVICDQLYFSDEYNAILAELQAVKSEFNIMDSCELLAA